MGVGGRAVQIRLSGVFSELLQQNLPPWGRGMFSEESGFLFPLDSLPLPQKEGETEPGLGFVILFVPAAMPSAP